MKVLIITFFVIFFVAEHIAQYPNPESKDSAKMSMEIENEWDGKAHSIRRVYILLAENEFGVEAVTRLIRKISKDFPVPSKLAINVFTNRERFSDFRVNESDGLSICFFPTTPEERAALEKYDEIRRPKPIGHFAQYYRDESGNEALGVTQKSGDDYIVSVDLGATLRE